MLSNLIDYSILFWKDSRMCIGARNLQPEFPVKLMWEEFYVCNQVEKNRNSSLNLAEIDTIFSSDRLSLFIFWALHSHFS